MKICGSLVDIHNRCIYPAVVTVSNQRIRSVDKVSNAPEIYILPGLIDSHIHIESSMITPGAFAEAAVKHGTTAVISDPHEIANVLGTQGIKFMLEDSENVPLKFFFGAPSCVPATGFESSGATLDHEEVDRLLAMPEIKYLSEIMNFPGVINRDAEILRKLDCARRAGKPIDGHAPGLSGEILKKYIDAGITTDHECSTMEEALEKISLGMKILIREGSAARNLNSLKELFNVHPDKIMLCSDDLHPEMLRMRHINKLIADLIYEGYDKFDVIRSATINPSVHYNLGAGLLRQGDDADFIIVDSLEKMNVQETWISGRKVYGDGKPIFRYKPGRTINKFNCLPISKNEIRVKKEGDYIRVIEAYEGELLTSQIISFAGTKDFVESNVSQDILKIVVKDRYSDSSPVVGFIKGFGLEIGAFASSVAHDSHNIISVGTNDTDIVNAINEVVRLQGGLAVSYGGITDSLQLNIGGIMTNRSCDDAANDYERLNETIRKCGCEMKAPFMTLSFMALLVIPDLKIGDKGLFDVKKFGLVSLFV